VGQGPVHSWEDLPKRGSKVREATTKPLSRLRMHHCKAKRKEGATLHIYQGRAGLTSHTTSYHCNLLRKVGRKVGLRLRKGSSLLDKDGDHSLNKFERGELLNIKDAVRKGKKRLFDLVKDNLLLRPPTKPQS